MPCVLEGLRVLFVEDNAPLSMSTTDLMERMGCRVTSAMSLGAALDSLTREPPDVAVLDIELGGVTSYPLAERLEVLGVPMSFLTAYAAHLTAGRWGGHPMCNKPCQDAELRRLLMEAAKKRGSVSPTLSAGYATSGPGK